MIAAFEGKVALVAGGGSGIGEATAMLFSEQGAHVVVADIDIASATKVADEIGKAGGTALPLQFDTTVFSDTKRLVADSLAAFGSLDVVASTVGWSDTTFFLEEGPDYWRKVIDLNLLGSIYLTHAALAHLSSRKTGVIVLTSSDAGKVGTMGESVYASAKAGIIGFVKSIAREVARDNIRINAIAPGPTDTPLLRAQSHKNVVDKLVSMIPLRRIATSTEQANAIAFLASEAASYITGQTLSVSGGLTMSS